MSTRRFCDVCDVLLKPEDDQPLIRELPYNISEGTVPPKVVAYVAITNENNHPLTDICQGCKLRVVSDGLPPTQPAKIATLQPQVAHDTRPSVTPFKMPDKPPAVPIRPVAEVEAAPVNIEPSLPRVDREQI